MVGVCFDYGWDNKKRVMAISGVTSFLFVSVTWFNVSSTLDERYKKTDIKTALELFLCNFKPGYLQVKTVEHYCVLCISCLPHFFVLNTVHRLKRQFCTVLCVTDAFRQPALVNNL